MQNLTKYTYDRERIEIVNATEVIETAEPPVNAIRRKKDSSIVVGMKLVKEGEADAFVSAGSSGAVLVGGQVIVGRIKGVERPPLAPLIPTEKGVSLLVDCGANVDARPSHLVQFAKMGSIYMEHVVGIKNPKVGIVNIGAEEEKGNALVKETFPLLKGESRISILLEVWRQERFRMDRQMSLSVKHLPVICILKLLRRCRKCAYFRDQERHDGKLKKQDRCASCKTGTEEDVEEYLTPVRVRRSATSGT